MRLWCSCQNMITVTQSSWEDQKYYKDLYEGLYGNSSDCYLGHKNSNKDRKRHLTLFPCFINFVFLEYLTVSVQFQRVLVLPLFFGHWILQNWRLLASEGLAYQPKEISRKFSPNAPIASGFSRILTQYTLKSSSNYCLSSSEVSYTNSVQTML